MPTYEVSLTSTAAISTIVTVQANTEDGAEAAAIDAARCGDVVWNYDGCDDENIEAVNTRKVDQ